MTYWSRDFLTNHMTEYLSHDLYVGTCTYGMRPGDTCTCNISRDVSHDFSRGVSVVLLVKMSWSQYWRMKRKSGSVSVVTQLQSRENKNCVNSIALQNLKKRSRVEESEIPDVRKWQSYLLLKKRMM